MINALTLLFLCQLAGEVLVRTLGITFPGPVLGMGLIFAVLLVAGRSWPAPRRRRRHACCGTSRSSSCRPRSASCSRPGSSRRTGSRSPPPSSSRPPRRSSSPSTPSSPWPAGSEATDARPPTSLPHLGLPLADPAPLADSATLVAFAIGDAVSGALPPQPAGEPGGDRRRPADPRPRHHRHALPGLLRGRAVRALPARPRHRRARPAALAQPRRRPPQPRADARGAGRRLDHRDRLGGRHRLGLRRAAARSSPRSPRSRSPRRSPWR